MATSPYKPPRIPASNDESDILSVEPAGDLAAPLDEDDIGLPWEVLCVNLSDQAFNQMEVEGSKDDKNKLPFLDLHEGLAAIQHVRQKEKDALDAEDLVRRLAL